MTPEGKVKEKVKKLLRSYGVYWHMPVQNGMGAPSLDFICCVRSKYLAIETKTEGKELTPRQKATAKTIEDSGGTVYVVRNESDLSFVELYLKLQGCIHAI